jgi:Rrf2 family protein
VKLNRPTLHTIHALVWIAQHGDGALVGGPAIAKAFDMVDEQMRAMLMVAARAGILQGIKGPNGGYRLARPAEKITLLEIIEAASGGIEGALLSKNEDRSRPGRGAGAAGAGGCDARGFGWRTVTRRRAPQVGFWPGRATFAS